MKVLLCILDGVGITQNAQLTIPFIQNNLHKGFLLNASGTAVGVMNGQMGNSEIGHITIGAGRSVPQYLMQINNAIKSNNFPILPMQYETYHVIGLLSNGGVHSHIDHILHIINNLRQAQKRIHIHIITDGRDVNQKSVEKYLSQLAPLCDDNCQIATICGRYYAMDRDNRIERTNAAYEAIAFGTPKFSFLSEYIQHNYNKHITDEFFSPAADQQYKGVQGNDLMIFCNFRSDRMRQIVQKFIDNKLNVISMVNYFDQELIPCLFLKPKINNSLSEVISQHGKKQLRIAETEKYAHVTFFLNCGRELPFDNENRILIPSPNVSTYDLQPEMSAYAITNQVIQSLGQYDFICVNFANADMVGHTGNFTAAKKACEVLNNCLDRIATAAKDYAFLITSDHGNIEQMFDSQTLQPHTAHTLNPVPFICINSSVKKVECDSEVELQDIAPTVLSLMQLPIPQEMTGRILFTEKIL